MRRHKFEGRLAPRRQGLTQIELLVVVGVLLLLAGLIAGVVSSARKSARSVTCTSNLRQIGFAFVQYAAVNNDKLPDPYLNKKSWESSLSTHLGGSAEALFRCPADQEVAPMIGSSYDWRDTGNPATTLAGHSIAEVSRASAVLALEALPGWHVTKTINVVRLDGSTATLPHRECFEDISKPIR